MNRPSSKMKGRQKAASVTGGGFSLLIFSPLALFFCLLWLLFNQGGMTYSVNRSGEGVIAPLFTREVQYWAREIGGWAEEYGVEANLIATVMQIESCGAPKVKSPAGALGLFQVMPFHFTVTENPLNPNTNARRGVQYLKQNLFQFGDVSLALAAYNGGPGTAASGSWQWPAETQNYVYWGERIYADAANWQSQSATLEAWLAAGGASLCQQASEQLGLLGE